MAAGGSQQQRQQNQAPPRVLHVVGRHGARENSDLCGEYLLEGIHGGRAAYRKKGAATAIRFAPQVGRWVIDRQGFRDSDVVVAYADNSLNSDHPGRPELIWHIWEPRAQAHVADAEVAALDAPAMISLVGRARQLENFAACGEYQIYAVHHGRPMYKQKNGDVVLRYHSPEGRWLVSGFGAKGNVCSAFADGTGASHPGFAELQWNFWESKRNAFVTDPATRTLASPALLHIIGRAPDAENGAICGTYHLAGAQEGRPMYVQPGTQKVIRYSSKSDRWLIDCDGLQEPSLMSKLYQWILSGDASAASERCSAFAPARGTLHPGTSALEWQVWEARAARHTFDPLVRGTTASLAVRVTGRESQRENGDIVGEYVLAGTHGGRPAYVKSGTRIALRFWAPARRWVIDREGLRNSDHCVAYADDPGESEHPCIPGPWYVYESSRGCHLADTMVTVSSSADAPKALRNPGERASGAAKRAPAPQPLPADGAADKRMRTDAGTQASTTVPARARWFASLGA